MASASPDPLPVVQTDQLSKVYGRLSALIDCTLTVRPGEVFGLLGPNGAGKSTLLRLVMGFLKPSGGQATVLGWDCYQQAVAVHRHVAYLPGDARLPRTMTGRQVLEFFSRLRGEGRAVQGLEVARRLDLDLRRRVMWMSTGMRQKLAVAATLAADASVVILDEPTANLDPTVRSEVLQIVGEKRQSGRTVILSSHVLSEVEEICDRVAILRQGSLVHTQGMADLRRRHRLSATLSGPLKPLPEPLVDAVDIEHNVATGEFAVETCLDLGRLLLWLGSLSLSNVTIERLGLASIYERFHRNVGS